MSEFHLLMTICFGVVFFALGMRGVFFLADLLADLPEESRDGESND